MSSFHFLISTAASIYTYFNYKLLNVFSGLCFRSGLAGIVTFVIIYCHSHSSSSFHILVVVFLQLFATVAHHLVFIFWYTFFNNYF